jgi:hypothetical protein
VKTILGDDMNTRVLRQFLSSLALLTVAAAFVLAGGVPIAGASSPAAKETIVGHFDMRGGVSGFLRPISGVITLTKTSTSGTKETVSVKVGRTGTFRVRVASGTWVATGRSPEFHINSVQAICRAKAAVVVTSNQRSNVSVVCFDKSTD